MSWIKKIFGKQKSILLSYVIAIIMFTIVSLLRPEFASVGHIKTIIIDAAILGTLALGQTMVILIGGIDLSIQWALCCSATAMTALYNGNDAQLLYLLPLILIGCMGIGLINGFGIAYLEIHPMIMTFGMNVILEGGLIAVTNGAPGNYAPNVINKLVLGDIAGIPNMLFIWLVIIIIATLLLGATPYGRKIYAVGNSQTVAYYSGIHVKRVKMIAYGISGLAAGLGGLLLAGKVGQSYLGMGDFVLFETIAVVAIGGTSMIGGSGNYLGTVAGAFVLTILTGLLSAFLMPASVQQILYGLVLLVAIILSVGRNRRVSVL